MAYGDYDGPDKPNKGKRGGACNRGLCQAEPALWWNRGSLSWYCDSCAHTLNTDRINKRDAERMFRGPLCIEVRTESQCIAFGIQPDPEAAKMVSDAAEMLEEFDDYRLGDL